jgi:hypothetical protein
MNSVGLVLHLHKLTPRSQLSIFVNFHSSVSPDLDKSFYRKGFTDLVATLQICRDISGKFECLVILSVKGGNNDVLRLF